MSKRLTQQYFEEKVPECNEHIDIIGNYIKDKVDIDFHCSKHDKYFTKKPGTFLSKKALGCNLCCWENGIGGTKYDDFDREYITSKCNGYKFVRHVSGRNGGTIVFICPSHEENGEQSVTWDQISSGKAKCKYCRIEEMRMSHDDFISRLTNINTAIDIITQYSTASEYVTCRCKKCDNEWNARPYNLLNGNGCPKCSAKIGGEKQRTSVGEKRKKLEGLHEDIEFLYVPKVSTEKIECKCKKCNHVWKANYGNLVNNKNNMTGCPKCNMSKGEMKIAKFFDENNIIYEEQKRFEECKDVSYLPFDFYLSEYNCCIEYDGLQHFQPVNFGGNENAAYKNYKYTLKHDQMKNKYCENNNIKLLRIPYYEYDSIEDILKLNFIK